MSQLSCRAGAAGEGHEVVVGRGAARSEADCAPAIRVRAVEAAGDAAPDPAHQPRHTPDAAPGHIMASLTKPEGGAQLNSKPLVEAARRNDLVKFFNYYKGKLSCC